METFYSLPILLPQLYPPPAKPTPRRPSCASSPFLTPIGDKMVPHLHHPLPPTRHSSLVTPPMLTLGIDPGTAIMGYGLVESATSPDAAAHGAEQLRMVEYGALYTPPHTPLVERLPMLYDGLMELLKEHKPQAVAIEALFFNKNVRTALTVGQARGVAILAAAHAGATVSEYTPLQVKQAVVGYGRATKEQVQSMIKIILNMDHIPRPDDAADALAIAVCHIHSQSYARLVAGS